MSIIPDAVADPPNGEYGALLNVAIFGDDGQQTFDSGHTISIQDSSRFEYPVRLNLRANTKIKWVSRYWYWASLTEQQFFFVTRLTATSTISIKNESNTDFIVKHSTRLDHSLAGNQAAEPMSYQVPARLRQTRVAEAKNIDAGGGHFMQFLTADNK